MISNFNFDSSSFSHHQFFRMSDSESDNSGSDNEREPVGSGSGSGSDADSGDERTNKRALSSGSDPESEPEPEQAPKKKKKRQRGFTAADFLDQDVVVEDDADDYEDYEDDGFIKERGDAERLEKEIGMREGNHSAVYNKLNRPGNEDDLFEYYKRKYDEAPQEDYGNYYQNTTLDKESFS